MSETLVPMSRHDLHKNASLPVTMQRCRLFKYSDFLTAACLPALTAHPLQPRLARMPLPSTARTSLMRRSLPASWHASGACVMWRWWTDIQRGVGVVAEWDSADEPAS